jgi:hypothetical protein
MSGSTGYAVLIVDTAACITESPDHSTTAACALAAAAALQPLLSMRTVYKVHLNFPGINTMEAKAGVVRKAAINRCRAELSGQAPLDKLKAELVVQEHWQEAGVGVLK